MEVSKFGEEMIFLTSVPGGLGANEVGVDRDQVGDSRIVRFQRYGDKVLLVQPNYAHRSDSNDPGERRAVEESFAPSVIAGFKVEAEKDGHVLIDIADFALSDVHDVRSSLKSSIPPQDGFTIDLPRSAVFADGLRSFPLNTEIEAILTFKNSDTTSVPQFMTDAMSASPPFGGGPSAFTIHERLSFIALPEAGYKPRRNDFRAGYFFVSYTDYSARLGQPLTNRLIYRYRLQKKDPTAAISDPVKPIIYYVDRGIPEDVRGAIVEGAKWWNDAFAATGYRDAFRVELLPADADPLDIRYNVVHWVYRNRRGWSWGQNVIDPRTGEIIRGVVLLDALRARYDYLLGEALVSPYNQGTEEPAEVREMVLSRLRQLAAHEIGHTLGLRHNFLGSAQGRTSVMDYPFPVVTLAADASVSLKDSFAQGIGSWDKVAITYGYQDFPKKVDEAAGLSQILSDARARGMTFLTDADARPSGSVGADPDASTWDNGSSAADELQRLLKVRRAALDRFGERAIRNGVPLAELEESFVPLYLCHRFQTTAAVKCLGGVRYSYALRGEGQEPAQAVSANEQEAALSAVLKTLDPAELVVPSAVRSKLPPRPDSDAPSEALFDRYTGRTFDIVSPADTAADLTLSVLLNDQVVSRLVQQHAATAELPGLKLVLDRLVSTTFGAKPHDPYEAIVARAVQHKVVAKLIDLAQDAKMPEARAIVGLKLDELRKRIEISQLDGAVDPATSSMIASEIRRFQDRPYDRPKRPAALLPPTGEPLGE